MGEDEGLDQNLDIGLPQALLDTPAWALIRGICAYGNLVCWKYVLATATVI